VRWGAPLNPYSVSLHCENQYGVLWKHLLLMKGPHKCIVKLLLDHGVEQEHLDTALRSTRKKDIVNLLLEHGAR
jgi:hypothetical protein